MKANPRIKVTIAIEGNISDDDKQLAVDTLKKNIRNYSFLQIPIDVELVG